MKPILLDASAIVALLDRREPHHQAFADILNQNAGALVTCESVISEACYLLRRVRGARDFVLSNVESGRFQVPLHLDQAAAEILRISRKYQDREVDLADACLIHLASELKTGDILTLDSNFRVYRWGANKPFRMLVSF